MLMEACPRMRCTTFGGVPAEMYSDAAVCRKPWIVRPSSLAARTAGDQTRCRKLPLRNDLLAL